MAFDNVAAAEESIHTKLQGGPETATTKYINEYLARMKTDYDKVGPTAYLDYLNVNDGWGIVNAISSAWENDKKRAPWNNPQS